MGDNSVNPKDMQHADSNLTPTYLHVRYKVDDFETERESGESEEGFELD